MRTRGLVPLTLTIVLLASAGLAAGHAAAGYDGWDRALHDCNDDWGDHEADTQDRSGHDLVALDVREGTSPDGTRALGLRLTMDLGFADGDDGWLNDTISFDVNGSQDDDQAVETTVVTTDNQTFTAVGDDLPLNPQLVRTDTDGRFYVDLWYGYDQLGLDSGDVLENFTVEGTFGSTELEEDSDRDLMAGGYALADGVTVTGCPPGTEDTRLEETYTIHQAPGQPPEARLTASATDVVTGEEITFNDTSTDPDDAIVAWSWDLGDGTTVDQRNVTHAYDAPGTYTVELTVTDERGNEATASQDITVSDAPPEAAFTWSPQQPEAGETVSFTDQSADPEDGSLSHAWTFGDGATSTAANPDHVYEAPGTYAVTLNVTDSQGQEATITQEVTVVEATPDEADDPEDTDDQTGGSGGGADGNQAPVAAMQVSPETPVVGQTVTFRDVSTDADGEITARNWTFGDQVSSEESPATHVYAEPGTYTVSLTVTDDQGATDTATVTIEVQPAEEVGGEDEPLNQTAAEGANDTNGTNATQGNETANGVPAVPMLAVVATLSMAAAVRRR